MSNILRYNNEKTVIDSPNAVTCHVIIPYKIAINASKLYGLYSIYAETFFSVLYLYILF